MRTQESEEEKETKRNRSKRTDNRSKEEIQRHGEMMKRIKKIIKREFAKDEMPGSVKFSNEMKKMKTRTFTA